MTRNQLAPAVFGATVGLGSRLLTAGGLSGKGPGAGPRSVRIVAAAAAGVTIGEGMTWIYAQTLCNTLKCAKVGK